MARYIDADALIRERTTFMQDEEAFDVSVVLVTDIKLAPTADVAEVKHGHWIYHNDDLFPAESKQECSVCHEKEDQRYITNENYCPNCGAKMDEEAVWR